MTSAISNIAPWTKSTCAYCGVGCGIEARPKPNGQLEIRGDKDHPANFGRLCSKGMALGETVIPDGRLLHPSINGMRTDWNSALDHVAKSFQKTIEEHGPDSVAFYVSGQLLTEDYYVANKLMKGFIGSGNIDTNSRLCMSSSVAGHKRAFGSDTVPGCYEDLELADLIVITGSNLAWCHPVLYQRIKAVKQQRPEVKVVSIDPRVTDTCEIADLHIALQPGSDVALFNGLLSHLASCQKVDEHYVQQHTEGYNRALLHALEDGCDPAALADTLGVELEDLKQFFDWFAHTDKVVTLYSQGVNQSSRGADKVNSILNCHLATGRIGKPGSGPFSLTGQPNAMGGREVGGLANTLAAHMELNSPLHHQLVSDFWQTDKLTTRAGYKAIDLFDAIDRGKIKAVWIMATNPVVSLPDADKIKRALTHCPLVVVSDCIADTDTTRCADVLLPAQGWSEKSGTVTNSERRISRQRRLLPTPGEGKPDWWIMSEVAKRMGFGDAFNYLHEGEVFDEYARMTELDYADHHQQVKRDLDLTGLINLTPKEYSQMPPQQWPLAKKDEQIENKRLFSDGRFFTPSGKAQFVAVRYKAPASKLSNKYPLSLNSGRIRDQWHTMTRTGLSTRLGAHLPEPYISVNQKDADLYGLENGKIASLTNEWGYARIRVDISSKVAPGQLFMPIHWTGVMASAGRVCSLVSPDTDAVSGQPEFKFTPVAIKPWHYQSEALLLSPTVIDTQQLDYWVRQKVDGGYLYRVASNDTPKELENKLKPYCTENHAEATATDPLQFKPRDLNARHLNFSSPSRGQYRFALIHGQQLRGCYLVAPSLQDQDFDWVQSLLDEPVDDNVERSILTGVASGKLAQGKTICACKQVGKTTLCNAIREESLTTVKQLGECTGAGTGCGTCVPELEQILVEELEQAEGEKPVISPAANSDAGSYKQASGDGLIVRVGH
ncbi:molybdopterin-dependent oxidoreductase [Pseudomaricurvus albidus]|uniref:molybdopterin-dependent oxidoreductase n=1 Tax=Pseudomaricurvus albidus TaxID=2842452 RepID=UPI0034E230AB